MALLCFHSTRATAMLDDDDLLDDAPEPEPDTDSDFCRWDRHESLSAADRNPSL